MHFAEAEQRYRELEDSLIRGDLVEEDFLAQVAQLRLVDEAGRRWMLSARSGRWLVHDGQQWVFAQPPSGEEAAEAETPAADQETAADIPAATPTTLQPRKGPPRPAMSRLGNTPRLVTMGILALLLIGCLVGGGISAWVFLLRDLGDGTPAPPDASAVALVETYTPRPSTPTYTPTFTVTPSRTPTPTITPTASRTPIPTRTYTPSPTRTPTRPAPTRTTASSPTPMPTSTSRPTSTPTPSPLQTYTVRQGDTLSEIAVRFGVSVAALADANGIDDPALVRVGQVLVIPQPGVTITPTWTPIVLTPPAATATRRPTATTPAPTTPAPTTPAPTRTPRPTATRTPSPPVLSGKIAFTVWNPYTNKYELYVSLIDGTGRNLLGEGFRQPQFRQDGNMLAVSGDGSPNFEHLVIMDPSGGAVLEVSNFSEDSYPTWSPDGSILAFSSTAWGDGRTLLGIVHDLYGKQQAWIPFGTTEVEGAFPFWLSDGRIVYHGCAFWAGGGICGLYKVASAGGNPQQLTTHESDTAPAAFNTKVAFMSARDGNWEVYSINMDGTGLNRLTNNNAQDGLPTWSPDGRSIAFVSNRGGSWAIWVMNANGSSQRKLFNLEGGYGSGQYDWTTERISWAP